MRLLTEINPKGRATLYDCDNANRLTQVTMAEGVVTTYAYDAADRRISTEAWLNRVTTTRYDLGTNVTATVAPMGFTTVYAYDGLNRQTSMTVPVVGTQTTTYAWDGDNRLTQVTLPSSATYTFAYHTDGMLLSRQSPTETTKYVWNGQVLQAEVDGTSNTTVSQYTQGAGAYGNTLNKLDVGSATDNYILPDVQGSAVNVTDSSGNVTQSATYSAFGSPIDQSGSTAPSQGYIAKQGYLTDPDLDLIYVRQRWYDPATKRWLSPDRTGFASGDYNFFRYVDNKAADRIDPSGLLNWALQVPDVPPDGIGMPDAQFYAKEAGERAAAETEAILGATTDKEGGPAPMDFHGPMSLGSNPAAKQHYANAQYWLGVQRKYRKTIADMLPNIEKFRTFLKKYPFAKLGSWSRHSGMSSPGWAPTFADDTPASFEVSKPLLRALYDPIFSTTFGEPAPGTGVKGETPPNESDTGFISDKERRDNYDKIRRAEANRYRPEKDVRIELPENGSGDKYAAVTAAGETVGRTVYSFAMAPRKVTVIYWVLKDKSDAGFYIFGDPTFNVDFMSDVLLNWCKIPRSELVGRGLGI